MSKFDKAVIACVATASLWELGRAAIGTHLQDAEEASTVLNARSQAIITRDIVNELNACGYVIIPNVLTVEEVRVARLGAIAVADEGRLRSSENDSTVRQDSICWLRENDGTFDATNSTCSILAPGLKDCISLLRGLANELQLNNYDRSVNHLVPMQCQLSRYLGNGIESYRPHRDAASSSNFWEIGVMGWFKSADYRKRKITAILYLNVPDWSAEDGGELRCYIDATLADKKNDATAVSSKNVVSVYPVGGVMVLFDSRMLLHDVAPCRSDRYALTLWIIGDDNNDKK